MSQAALAQRPPRDTTSVTVTGRVSTMPDSTVGVPFAEVLFKGKSKGTSTDENGNFRIVGYASTDTSILVSLPGYVAQEIRLGDETTDLRIVLTLETPMLNVGIGQVPEALSPYSVGKVGRKAFEVQPTASYEAGLQGRVAGMQVTQSNGNTAAAVFSAIRGKVTLMGDAAPLVVLDGVPLITGTNGDGSGGIGNSYGSQNSVLAELNTNDIEDVVVLKDGASQAMYGARGANGVVLITTKKGQTGKTRFNLSYNTGISDVTNRVKLANGNQYRTAAGQAWQNSFGTAAPGNPRYLIGGDSIFGFTSDMANNTNTNWVDKALRTGAFQNANLTISGGSKRVNFYSSVDYRTEQGVIKGTNQDRLSIRFNAENKATDFLTIGLRTQLSLSFGNYAPSGTDTTAGFGVAQSRALPVFAEYLPDGTIDPYNNSNRFFNAYRGTNATLTGNDDFYRNERNVFRNVGLIYASFNFLKNFNFRTEAGLDYFNNNDRTFRSGFTRLRRAIRTRGDTALAPTAAATDARQLTYNAQLNNYLTWRDTLGSTQLEVLAGNQYTNSFTSFNLASSERLPNEYSGLTSAGAIGFGLPTGGNNGYLYNAWFAKATAIISGKYLFTVSGRAESSSRFGDDALWAFFPAAAASYLISEEEAIKNISWIDALKVRGSLGLTGNSFFENDIAVGYWRGGPSYVDPSTFSPGRSQLRLPNGKLTADQILNSGVGVDASLFANRLHGSVDFYYRTNTNALMPFPVAPSQGVTNAVSFENLGRLSSTGVELALSAHVVKSMDFNYTTNLMFAFNQSKVDDLSGLTEAQAPAYRDLRFAQNSAYGSFFLARWAGVADADDAQGRWKAGDELLLDRNGNRFRPTSVAQIDSARVMISGKSSLPTFVGGWNNTLTYKGFDLGVFFTYTWGQHLLDYGAHSQSYVTGGSNLREDALNRANLYYSAGGTGDPLAQRATDRFLTNASHVRLRSLTLGYTLPQAWCRARGLAGGRVFIAGHNLLTIAPDFKGWDPEVAGNAAYGLAANAAVGTTQLDLPQIRTYMLGLSITF